MPVLDITSIAAARQKALQAKAEAERVATTALQEFASVATQIGLPLTGWGKHGTPQFLTVNGFDAGWVVLWDTSWEHAIHQKGSGLIVRRDGQTYFGAKPVDHATAGQWLARQLDLDSDRILSHLRGLFTAV